MAAGRLRPWLELARLSNAPTVVTNVLTGCAIGAGAGAFPWPVAARSATGVLLLYTGGMVLNDVADAGTDRHERPGRPIPSGRVSRGAALAVAALLLAAGVVVAAMTNVQAAVLAGVLCACIIAYDLVHRATGLSVLLLGACRGLAIALAAAAASPRANSQVTAALASCLAAYTIGFSLVARAEATRPDDSRGGLAGLIAVVPLLVLLRLQPEEWLWTVLTAAALCAWLLRPAALLHRTPPQVGPAVHAWIAGICLLDAYFVTILGHPQLAPVDAACFGLTLLLHRRIPGT